MPYGNLHKSLKAPGAKVYPTLTTLLAAGCSHPVLGVGLPGSPFGGFHEI
jgi:hypothetical protein